MTGSSPRYSPWLAVVAACLLFAGAYYQDPLFTSNQNTYFLPGLARAGFGHLSEDWLVRQSDAVPVFSFLVRLVHGLGAHWMFYLLHGFLAAVYAGSLFVLARAALPGNFKARLSAPLFFALLTLAHCPWLFDALFERLGLGLRVAWRLEDLMYGVAGQYTLSRILQPSMFGILMITSVACFVRGRVAAAVVVAVAAACLHTSMVLHAGILTAAYMAALAAAGRPRAALKTGALAAVLVAPIAIYLAARFVLADPAAVREAGGLISADLRQPHHALVSVWLTSAALTPLGLIAAGLVLAYRHRRPAESPRGSLHGSLFLVLAVCAALAAALTALQAASGSRSLALLFPWRTSAWLVPVCAALLLARFSGRIASRLDAPAAPSAPSAPLRRTVRNGLLAASCLLLVIAAGCGAAKTVSAARADRDQGTVIGYARDHAAAGQRYLVPLDFDRFRLATGVPVFVDWKSFPYRSREILDWHDRVQRAQRFYAARDADAARAALEGVRAAEAVTHAIVEGDSCDLAEGRLEFRDGRYAVCRLSEPLKP